MSISVPTELDEQIEAEAQKHDMTYSEYVRTVLKNHTGTPFEPSEIDISTDDSDAREAQMGGA